jgi:hypothetical protein
MAGQADQIKEATEKVISDIEEGNSVLPTPRIDKLEEEVTHLNNRVLWMEKAFASILHNTEDTGRYG